MLSRALPAALCLLLAGCAGRRQPAPVVSGNPEDRVFSFREVSVAPRLIGCAGYTDPGIATTRTAYFEFQFVVDRDGAIVPTSAVFMATPRRRANDAARQRAQDALVASARQALLSCSYEPARHVGTTVAVRMRRVMRFAT